MNGITTQFEKEQSPIKCESFWSPQLHVKLWFCIIHLTAIMIRISTLPD